jgi:cysteine desulfurase / selenocysteine lyase
MAILRDQWESGTMSMGSASFDAAVVKRQFPGLADPQLHYLDSAATAQMPEGVLDALRRFEVEARANVNEGMHRRARAATDAFQEARARVARFLNAWSDQEVVFTYGTTSSINLLAHCFGTFLRSGDEILLSILEHHSNLVPCKGSPSKQELFCGSCP